MEKVILSLLFYLLEYFYILVFFIRMFFLFTRILF